MTRRILIAVAVILLSAGAAQADEKFEHATIRLEQSVTDKDAEIMLEATGGDAGLAALHAAAALPPAWQRPGLHRPEAEVVCPAAAGPGKRRAL